MVTRDIRWPAGTPCWVDVSVDDVPRAIAFYEALFGWDIQVGGPEVGGYSIAHQDGRIVAGVTPKMGPAEAPSAWLTYLATDDADATAAKIKGAGGQLLAEPMDVMSEGRMAVALDTAGAAFGIWQGGNTTGIGVANEPGTLTWNEHLSRDFGGSEAFYQAVFGYDYQDMSGDGFKYAMVMVDGHEVGGIGEYPEGTPAGQPAVWSSGLHGHGHRRRGGQGHRARRPRDPARHGHPVRPDRRRRRPRRRGLLPDQAARQRVRLRVYFMPNGPGCVSSRPGHGTVGCRACERTRSSSGPRPDPGAFGLGPGDGAETGASTSRAPGRPARSCCRPAVDVQEDVCWIARLCGPVSMNTPWSRQMWRRAGLSSRVSGENAT